jgi:two-component system sensor histidine kinase/response regulator
MRQLAEILAKWIPESLPGDNASPDAFPTVEPAAADPLKAVFDEKNLLDRLIGDRQLAGMILQAFLEDVPTQLSQLRKRLDESDGPGATLKAHSLVGAAGAVSAGGLLTLAKAMERAGKAGELKSLGDLLPRTAEEFDGFKTVLENAGWI